MAKEIVAQRGITIRVACQVFSVSESCDRYEAKQDAQNRQIATAALPLGHNVITLKGMLVNQLRTDLVELGSGY